MSQRARARERKSRHTTRRPTNKPTNQPIDQQSTRIQPKIYKHVMGLALKQTNQRKKNILLKNKNRNEQRAKWGKKEGNRTAGTWHRFPLQFNEFFLRKLLEHSKNPECNENYSNNFWIAQKAHAYNSSFFHPPSRFQFELNTNPRVGKDEKNTPKQKHIAAARYRLKSAQTKPKRNRTQEFYTRLRRESIQQQQQQQSQRPNSTWQSRVHDHDPFCPIGVCTVLFIQINIYIVCLCHAYMPSTHRATYIRA